MAIAATELRPRSAVALFDAAIRLCARSTGLWVLTLPGGAAVTAAAIHFLESVRAGDGGWSPALWLTAAWFFRGLCQAAAAHWTQQLLVGPGEASAARSFLAALRRLPSLCTGTVVLGAAYLLTTFLTMGVGLFFFSAHLVGYAAAMQGKGHPLALWGTANQLLGPARRTANSVRLCLWSQVVLLVNLHLAAQLGLYLAQTLFGLNVTFATRYASLDNPAWILTVVATCFTLVEPLRAALGSLLLLDGQVRQEGLDLLSAVEQLPSRARPPRTAAAAVLLALGAALWSPPARAQQPAPSAPQNGASLRLLTVKLARACNVPIDDLRNPIDALADLDRGQRAAYQRHLDRVGWYVDDDDCDVAQALLVNGLAQVEQLVTQQRTSREGPESSQVQAQAQARARAILERPEFQEAVKAPGPEVKEESAWDRFWRRVGEWLRELFRPRPRVETRDVPTVATGGGEWVANALAVVLVAAVVIALVVVLVRFWRPGSQAEEVVAEMVSVPAPPQSAQESALSRPPEGWAALADELAARGQYREAVRGLYLAALSRLHHEGALDYDPALSNWDHVRRYKGPPPWKPPFRELTLRFDFVFYGNVATGEAGYSEFRALARPLFSPAAGAATTA